MSLFIRPYIFTFVSPQTRTGGEAIVKSVKKKRSHMQQFVLIIYFYYKGPPTTENKAIILKYILKKQ